MMVGVKMAASVEGELLGGSELCIARRTGICFLESCDHSVEKLGQVMLPV